MNELPLESKESPVPRRSGCRRGASAVLGDAAGTFRDTLARRLVAVGVTPNILTVAGLLLTACAAACLVAGAGHAAPWEASRTPTASSWWPLLAAAFLMIAGLADLLDGAVARAGNQATPFGAMLDSTLDRFSDLFIFTGCAIHFCLAANLTYVALSLAAAANAVLISYVKARAENLIDHCEVGYWQRGERCGFFLLAAFLGHIPAALLFLGTLPLFTVIRRLRHTRCVLAGLTPREPTGWMRYLRPWRHPRGSAGYDVAAGLGLLFLVAGPLLWPGLYGASDPLRPLLVRFSGTG